MPHAGLLIGAGNSSNPEVCKDANANFGSFYVKSTAVNGTSRGLYFRTYLSSGAGGETLRAFTTVENNAPADTVNGAHISLNFGSSAGNITGEGHATRNTLHLPNRSLGGTFSAVQAEIWSDGSSSDIGGTGSFLRISNAGDATGMGNVDLHGLLFDIQGLTSGDGKLFYSGAAPSTLAASLKCQVGGTIFYLPLYSAQHA